MGNLDISASKEWFSVAYVQALAYSAGYAVMLVHVDHFGVDLEIRDRAFRVDVQMKCTEGPAIENDYLSYDLDVRTYNLLSDPERNVPAYLFVVEVPGDRADWANCSQEGLHLRKCGYFGKMSTLRPTQNRSTKSVRLDRANRLTVRSLDRLMKESRGMA
ncbi:DUF4365 domain-containing protein [Microtetraspora sp. AC03309]|uniref:DUF4365 domain-containing protein n=1 Tax=Microtetraspora sp. AC03309 TaxID=2779376 RepID=UPI001E5A102D|nr:DUF4365 domain-containing protein [Microtetraspora sp. AC03309]MCC5578984.1 DUF4365 domain-containing protein [Microtetraspora sp. AC03309]